MGQMAGLPSLRLADARILTPVRDYRNMPAIFFEALQMPQHIDRATRALAWKLAKINDVLNIGIFHLCRSEPDPNWMKAHS